MKGYTKILSDLVIKQVGITSNFVFIKIKDFTNPEIYLKLVKDIFNKIDKDELNLIIKLSQEKYKYWYDNENNKTILDLMMKDNIVSTEKLTFYRNLKHNRSLDKMTVILLGTEIAEDQGGLDDFYAITPSSIEDEIGDDYSKLFKINGFQLQEDESGFLNLVYKSIFKYVQKDLFKLSNFIDTIPNNIGYLNLINEIFSTLYEYWTIPNIKSILTEYGAIKKKKKISLIENSYKFSRRVGLDKYLTDKKIKNLKENILKYYQYKKNDIDNDFNNIFPDYDKFDDVIDDLINYIEGKNISIKSKLFECDFKIISEMLGYRPKDTGTNPPPPPTLKKISGDPFKALFMPILLEVNNFDIENKNKIKNIQINIEEVSLVNTKSKDNNDLKIKWKNMIRFLGGIEYLFNNFMSDDIAEGDIELSINSGDEDLFYPFSPNSIKRMIDEGILKSASNNKTKSKIVMEYYFIDYENEILDSIEYQWEISETDIWINVFNFMNGQFKELIQDKTFLPIGYSSRLDSAFGVKNKEEFIYSIKDLEVQYTDIYNLFKNKSSQSAIMIEELSKKFPRFIEYIDRKGLFSSICEPENNTLYALEFINSYNNIIPSIIEDIKNDNNISLVNQFSKVFLILNTDQFNLKYIKGSLMNPYHPVMLEKIIDRYIYLTNGFMEILGEIIKSEESFTNKIINDKFNRFEQLATITSGASIMYSEKNKFITSNATYEFYSLYGESNDDYRSSTIKVDFETQDDFEEVSNDNPISTYISKAIQDYLKVYPYKANGLSISFINYNNYNTIITGLYNVITKIKKLEIDFEMDVYIYTYDYIGTGRNYIQYWLENKFSEDENIKIKVYLKYITFDRINIEGYINDNFMDTDIVFVKDILEEKEIEEQQVNNVFDKKLENRYPSVYLPIISNEERVRKVAISQNQFECEENYTKLMVFLRNPNTTDAKYRIVKRVELTERNEKLIEEFHKKANWVVIFDENIDTKILKLNRNKVIGFSTGNGYFGEINVAISTQQDKIKNLYKFLKRRLKHRLSNWSDSQLKLATEKCIDSALYLDGGKIITAINPEDESICNYLAYILTIEKEKLLDVEYNKNYYVRKIVNLDSHSHLFDNQLELKKDGEEKYRPDFLIVEIPKEQNNYNNLKIKIKIIECKLSGGNYNYLDKAKIQITNGYKTLKRIWDNNNSSVEKKFWFNQLYRILAYENSAERINDKEQILFINTKLEAINDGNFEIEFENDIYAFYTDERDDEEYVDTSSIEDDTISINIKSFGNKSLKFMLTGIEDEYENKDEEINNQYKNPFNTAVDDCAIDEESISNEHKENKREVYNETEDNKISIDDIEVGEESNESNKDVVLSKKHKNFIDLLMTKDDYIQDVEEENDIRKKINDLKNELNIRKVKINVKNDDFIIGPDIIRIRATLGTGVDFNKIEKYSEDMKLWLRVNEKPLIFIEEGFVNIDIVRDKRRTVKMANVLTKLNNNFEKYYDYKDKFYVLIGEDLLGNIKMIDLNDSNSPHLLIAGQTGSGKSVLLNSMLVSIMFIYEPDDIEMILIDPKQVELTVFEDSPFTKNNYIFTEPEEAIKVLDSLVEEMDERYKLFRKSRVKNIASYNEKFPDNKQKRILLVFDEFGAMIEDSKEVKDKLEYSIKKLAQKARAAGIHMIISTQTPRADIITTTIRNNLTARIALKVTDSNASSLILDSKGAESLLGKGDMLIKTAESSTFVRTKSPYIDEDEIYDIINYLNSGVEQ